MSVKLRVVFVLGSHQEGHKSGACSLVPPCRVAAGTGPISQPVTPSRAVPTAGPRIAVDSAGRRHMERSMDTPAEPVGDGLSMGFGGSDSRTTEGGGVHRSRQHLLTPVEVRWQRFPMTRFGRRGLAPDAVASFLHRVETDLDALYREIVAARDEACHYRDALMVLQAECWRPREQWAPRRRGEYRRSPMWPPYSGRQEGGHQLQGGSSGDD
ncbi:DivIVA domain-containing protein [Micromonospora sp. CA-111912]|uniref:DivIVA domain-containing protein n=1 Tax=Micromonospora sp. CA-111912 TaxID=3239955 RepID=UPI003D937D03